MTHLGPDLPEPHELFEVDTYYYRWPSGAEKVELARGVLQFQGQFDHRDVEIAQRAYPGRQILINEDGGLEVHPASDDPPQTVYQRYYKNRLPKRGSITTEADPLDRTSPEPEQR